MTVDDRPAPIRDLIMKSILRDLPYWTLPPGLYRLAGVVKRKLTQRLDRETRDVLEKNKALGGRHSGERVFLLGCGPSIKSQNLKPLQNEICMSVSNFFVHPDFETINPAYHILSGRHEPITEEAWSDWVKEVDTATREATILTPLTDRPQIVREGLFPDRRLHYLNTKGTETDIIRSGILLDRGLLHGGVLVLAVQVLIYMGFKQIYLLGFDQDQVLNYQKSRHFYGEEESAMTRGGYSEWFYEDFGRCCMFYVEIWDQLRVIRRVAENAGVEIINATSGGCLDLFPRAVYEELV